MDRSIQPSAGHIEKLTAAAKKIYENRFHQLGYPFDQQTALSGFYTWLVETGICDLTLINVGDPYKKGWDMLNTDEFERASIDFMADALGFGRDHWGVLSNGGTDGNMHGLYFGRKYLQSLSDKAPILYVSEEAHYSLKKLGDILNIETRPIKAKPMGQMDVSDFAAKLDASRPALVAVAIGGTFKGAIDDQREISRVLREANPPAVYRHVDAALFGGYLPFLDDTCARETVDASRMKFDSISVSGHKFFGLNEPAGIFVCRKDILSALNSNPVPYLNGVIPTISCSRSGFDALKLYWRITSLGEQGFKREAEHVLNTAKYFHTALEQRGIRAWRNPYSNTVFFARPSNAAVHKYALACSEDAYFGRLSHAVVMQYFTRQMCDEIAADIASLR